MGTRMAKPALDVGLVTADAEPLLTVNSELAGFERHDPLEIPNIGTIHRLACGDDLRRFRDWDEIQRAVADVRENGRAAE